MRAGCRFTTCADTARLSTHPPSTTHLVHQLLQRHLVCVHSQRCPRCAAHHAGRVGLGG